MIEEAGEDVAKSILATFVCPPNPEIEDFLLDKAIDSARQGRTATHLLLDDANQVIAYFTVMIKIVSVQKERVAGRMKQRVARFADQPGSPDNGYYEIPAYLIAQFGKNYSPKVNESISGDELMAIAYKYIGIAQKNIGGRIVYIECDNNNKLVDFYSRNSFIAFGERPATEDNADGRIYIQMLRYVKGF